MSKYTIQDTTEENGRKLFASSLDSNFFLPQDFAAEAGKDRYPDIDGQIRLRDGNGTYINLYLHYQLKSTSNLDPQHYSCDGSILDYLVSTNVPTLMVVADVTNNKVYWHYIDEEEKMKLGLVENGNPSKTLDLSANIIEVSDGLQLNELWKRIAKSEKSITQLNDAVSKIANTFHQSIQNTLGLLYLLQRVPKVDLADLFNKILKIEKSEVETIIGKLIQEEVITETAHYYLIDNEQLGVESLYKLLDELNPADLEFIFPDLKDRKRIIEQLAKIEHETAENYLTKLADEMLQMVENPTSNDDIFAHLGLLNEYAFRVPDKALDIIQTITIATPLPATVTEYKGFGPLEGKTHLNLITESVEILERIRYRSDKIFDALVELSKSSEETIKNQSLKAIEHLSQYNFNVLKQIGYGVQASIIEKIEAWDETQIIENKDALIIITQELLTASFEGTSYPDYKTMTFHSGSLNASDPLKDIRNRTLLVLEKLYTLTTDLEDRKKILIAIQHATQAPDHGSYGEDMEQMITDNTNAVIEYYLKILPEAENDLVKDIEEQTYWFGKRFSKEKLSKLQELKNAIATKDDYGMFKVFVGYDGRFEDTMDWDKAAKMRNDKIQEFVAAITQDNLSDWYKKIQQVIKNYSQSEPGEFQYFNTFLFELAKQKPELALQLINEPELEPFLIHLLAGIWSSPMQEKAKQLILDWTTNGQHLKESAFLFNYVESMDIELLQIVFKKAAEVADVRALNNIVSSITRNYSKDKQLKALMIVTIKELTKNKDYWWVNSFWYRSESILNDFDEKELEAVLENLLLLPNIEFHAEEIMLPIAEKYPEKVINFLFQRVLLKSKREKSLDDRYDAVPFNFHKLNEALKTHEPTILPMLLGWYSEGDENSRWLFRWEASHILEEILPSFSPQLEKTLIDMINTDQKDALEIAQSIINKHKGGSYLWSLIKAIVEKYSTDKNYEEIRGGLFGSLTQTGVVSGEYGFVEALQKKLEEVQQFKDDSSSAFRAFIAEYEKHLGDQIEYHQKRADEEIELRKRDMFD